MPAALECTWTITGEPGQTVQLSFTDLALEDATGDECTGDNLRVTDSDDTLIFEWVSQSLVSNHMSVYWGSRIDFPMYIMVSMGSKHVFVNILIFE
jgi:hypothetical protein